MKKNYYDILQVNKNASAEIIEKAYKVLAKKYHPDLQPAENKEKTEDILKEINEAYEVLSNMEKRQSYDASLLKEEQQEQTSSASSQQFQQQYSPNNYQAEQQSQIYQEYSSRRNQEQSYQEQLQQARQKAYYDAYIQDLKNRGYKIRYKKSFKEYFKTFIAIVLTILVLLLIYQIPFVKNLFADLYEENEIFHFLIDIIINFF